jgi:YidC/Oxa1 family membrane protein insertase
VLPFVFVISGVAFPIGVLFYWTTSNLWTMGQQFYVIRNNPVPGTPAAKAKQERDAAKLARKGESDPTYLIDTQPDTAVGTGTPATPQRQQPKRQSRSQRKKQGPPRAKPAQPTQDQQDEGDERGRNSA